MGSFCEFNDRGELFVINMNIQPYSHATYFNHDSKADRKLLLNKQELKKLKRNVEKKGQTIVPLRLFINKRGLAKLQIALGKGKKQHDKRQTIKERESKRKIDRIKKQFG